MTLEWLSERKNGKSICSIGKSLHCLAFGFFCILMILSDGASLGLAGEVANSTPQRPGSGYKFVARNLLAEAGEKYDGQPLCTYGIVQLRDGIAYLSDPHDASIPHPLDADVCLEISKDSVEILRRLTSLGVGVWGIYHRSVTGTYKNCRNGAIKIQSLEISFE